MSDVNHAAKIREELRTTSRIEKDDGVVWLLGAPAVGRVINHADALDTALREARQEIADLRASRERWINLAYAGKDLHERWGDLIEAGEVVKIHEEGVYGYELVEDDEDADGATT